MAVVRPNPVMDFLTKDSGVLIEGLEYETVEDYDAFVTALLTAMDTEKYLGITRGGNSFSLENETRIIEYDGRRVRVVGDFSVDNSTPQIETTLIVHSVENLRRVMPMSDVTEEDGKYSIRPRLGSPRPEDYMESLSWVREQINGDIEVVTLFKAINTGTASMTGADASESEMPVTFVGNARDFKDTEHAPVEIIVWRREPEEP